MNSSDDNGEGAEGFGSAASLAASLLLAFILQGCETDRNTGGPGGGERAPAAESAQTTEPEADGRDSTAGSLAEPAEGDEQPSNVREFKGGSAITTPGHALQPSIPSADRPASGAATRLENKQMQLRGRIRTIDRKLGAFDRRPPGSGPGNATAETGGSVLTDRPDTVNRRLDLERRGLRKQERAARRDLRRLKSGRRIRSGGSTTGRAPARGLFGGSSSY